MFVRTRVPATFEMTICGARSFGKLCRKREIYRAARAPTQCIIGAACPREASPFEDVLPMSISRL
jgi:hypothetical protein